MNPIGEGALANPLASPTKLALIIATDHLSAAPGSQSAEQPQIHILLDEMDRAVAEQEVAPARVETVRAPPVVAIYRAAQIAKVDRVRHRLTVRVRPFNDAS